MVLMVDALLSLAPSENSALLYIYITRTVVVTAATSCQMRRCRLRRGQVFELCNGLSDIGLADDPDPYVLEFRLRSGWRFELPPDCWRFTNDWGPAPSAN
jgi:hypothetical protein